MGGYGSGPKCGRRYRSVETSWSLDIVDLHHRGLIRQGLQTVSIGQFRVGSDAQEPAVEFSLRLDLSTDPSYRINYQVMRGVELLEAVDIRGALLCTFPQYGGTRWWFGCPRCGARVRVLYLPPGSTRFACRSCHRLRYNCQVETIADRLQRKSRKLYRRAGSQDGGGSFTRKPARMHWRTFNRLIDAAENAGWRSILAVPVMRGLLRGWPG
jgi:hypothetical protein